MEFSNEFINVLDYLGKQIGLAIDWSSQNVMPYLETLAKKFINWEIGTNMFWIIFGLVFVIAGYYCVRYAKYCFKKAKEDPCSAYDLGTIFVVIGTICCFSIGFSIVTCNIYDLIKVIIFPELRLYEYMTLLLKRGV